MTLPAIKIHRLHAVIEDASSPFEFFRCSKCYEPSSRAIRAASSIKPSTPTIKETPTMGYNQTQYDIVSPVAKNLAHVPGVYASNDPKRLVGVLSALGLVEDRMAAALTTIAASGDPSTLRNFYQVSVYRLDAALRQTEASIENRMAFKASLHRAGLLAEPVR